MTNRQKEMLVLAFHYYHTWCDGEVETDPNLKELITILRNQKTAVSRNEMMPLLKKGIERLSVLTEGEDVVIDALIFCIGFVALLIEEDAFKGYTAIALRRLVITIFSNVEAKERTFGGFKMANKIITRYYLSVRKLSYERY